METKKGYNSEITVVNLYLPCALKINLEFLQKSTGHLKPGKDSPLSMFLLFSSQSLFKRRNSIC